MAGSALQLRLGSRASALAQRQSQLALDLLQSLRPDVCFSLSTYSTTGDRIQDKPLAAVGGKGLFVKELERALLAGALDAAVHSLKDVPGDMDSERFELIPVGERADPRDALLLAPGCQLTPTAQLRFGTCSLRRAAQLQLLYPKSSFAPLRGNVQTRIAKLTSGDFDAIVLAAAGLRRLNLGESINQLLSVESCVPAIGQGVIALQIRRGDRRWDWLSDATDPKLRLCIACERALARALGVDCFSTLGAHASWVDGRLQLRVFYQHGDKTQRQSYSHAPTTDARAIESWAYEVAERLLNC